MRNGLSTMSLLQPFSVACGICLNCFLDVVHVQKVKRTSEAGSCDHLMTPFISNNLKACIPVLHHEHGFSVKRICSILNVRKTLAYETLCHHCTHGITFDLNIQQWSVWHCGLTSVDLAFIHMLLNQKHTMYLDEIQEQLLSCCSVKVLIPTLTRTLHWLHFTYKDISGKALRRSNQIHWYV